MATFAAIDIGSNTFRLMVAKPAAVSHITPWHIQAYTHRIVRLGEGLHQSGNLCEAARLRALDAFHAFSDILNLHAVDAEHTYAVATAAMREADNGPVFCQQVLEKTGIQIHIIQGSEEANMSLLGSCAVLPPAIQENFLLFDIGGGSTEFVRAKQGQCLDAISRKLGVVRLVEAHLKNDPPSADDYDAMCQTCQQHLEAVEAHWLASQGHQTAPAALVGTAGTMTTLAAIDLDMHDYDANLINNHRISYTRFLQLKQKLLAMTHQERQAIPSIETGRADLMIAGLAIMDSIFKRWGHQSIHIVDAGLLEGAWLFINHTFQSKK
ncbi:MAG: Ppx/GppA phosphatase family protein [Mariprofundaceae bacterium]|nr:Ppx/GppA phosphatase family protein [Mariprofundaceae bacterium]